MKARARQAGEITGRHVLLLLVAFFGTIIAVNTLLAVLAEKSWTGLVVENSYVESQLYNGKIAEAREQAALGWHGSLSIGGGSIRYVLASAGGTPVRLDGAIAHFRHPAYESADFAVKLDRPAGGGLSAEHPVPDGAWIVEVEADAGGPRPFREVSRILVRDGRVR